MSKINDLGAKRMSRKVQPDAETPAPSTPPASPGVKVGKREKRYRPETDWATIEAAFRLGHSRAELCRMFNVPPSTLDNRIARQRQADPTRWVRANVRDVQLRAQSMLIESAAPKDPDTPQVVDAGAAILAAAEQVKSVLLGHRTEIGKARRLLDYMLGELESASIRPEELRQLVESATRFEEMTGDERGRFLARVRDLLALGQRTASLERLVRSMAQLQAAERSAYQIPAELAPEEPGAGLSDAELEADIERMERARRKLDKSDTFGGLDAGNRTLN